VTLSQGYCHRAGIRGTMPFPQECDGWKKMRPVGDFLLTGDSSSFLQCSDLSVHKTCQYTVSQKWHCGTLQLRCTLTNFGRYVAERDSQLSNGDLFSHLTWRMSLHYLAKHRNMKIAPFKCCVNGLQESNQSPHVSPGNTTTLVRWGGKTNQRLIAYSQ